MTRLGQLSRIRSSSSQAKTRKLTRQDPRSAARLCGTAKSRPGPEQFASRHVGNPDSRLTIIPASSTGRYNTLQIKLFSSKALFSGPMGDMPGPLQRSELIQCGVLRPGSYCVRSAAPSVSQRIMSFTQKEMLHVPCPFVVTKRTSNMDRGHLQSSMRGIQRGSMRSVPDSLPALAKITDREVTAEVFERMLAEAVEKSPDLIGMTGRDGRLQIPRMKPCGRHCSFRSKNWSANPSA